MFTTILITICEGLFNYGDIKHVAVYLRLSRDEEHKGIDEILASHRNTLTVLCKQNKWSYEMFEEIASSSTIEKRDKMVELLERIQNNEFDAVVVMDIDRLSRNEFDASEIKRILFKTGTSIVTPSKTYNLSKDEDKFVNRYSIIGCSSRVQTNSKTYATWQAVRQHVRAFCEWYSSVRVYQTS